MGLVGLDMCCCFGSFSSGGNGFGVVFGWSYIGVHVFFGIVLENFYWFYIGLSDF